MLFRYLKEKDDFLDYLNSNDALFHYTRKSTALEKILFNRQLKFGSFSGTNDPQEYRPKRTGAVGWGWDSDSTEVAQAMIEVENICQKRTGFLSFCVNRYENGDIKENGLLKSRMWAQYGDNHEGACVIFSKSALINILDKHKNEHQVLLHSDVEYKNPERKNQPILKANKSDFDGKNHFEIALDFVLENKDNYLFSKQTDYRDECEYRVIMINKQTLNANDSNILIDVESALVGIVFGDRFQELYAPTVKELIKDTKIVAKRLLWEKGEYFVLDLLGIEKI